LFCRDYPMSIVLSVISIIVCGGAGALVAWTLVSVLGWGGIGGTIAMAVVGMVVATVLFAAGAALIQALRLRK
jgi:hypothetical protein